MSESGVKKLYLAKSVGQLNESIDKNISAHPRLLVKSAEKILKEAQLQDKLGDEEKAYILYMRYFSTISAVQRHREYKLEKKFYDSMLDKKITTSVVARAEALQKSLSKRYELESAKKMEEEERKAAAELKEKKRKEEESTKLSKPKAKPFLEHDVNGVAEDRTISCQKLMSLIKQQCSTFLVLDARPKNDFMESSMKHGNVINIPEEILKPGLTAGKIQNSLSESAKNLWASQRHNVEYLIICDWFTEKEPLPPPLQALVDAMVKWDPGKKYKSQPLLLHGGYDMWRVMYPIESTNPRVNPPMRNLTIIKPEEISLDFQYPDLDQAFISTPSPKQVNDLEAGGGGRGIMMAKPPVNRNLKPLDQFISDSIQPKVSNTEMQEILDGKNNNANIIFPSDSGGVGNGGSGEVLGKYPVDRGSSRTSSLESRRLYNNEVKMPSQKTYSIDKIDNITPSVPPRSLKPKELLESKMAREEIEKEHQLLEETMKVEEDTMKKIEEMEETQRVKDSTRDELGKARLKATEDRLQEEIKRLKSKSDDMESKCKQVQKQNEELWKVVNQVLSAQMSNLNISKETGSAAAMHAAIAIRNKEAQDQELLQNQEDKRNSLQEQVKKMRKERKEKERRIAEQMERNRLEEQRKKEAREQVAREEKLRESQKRLEKDYHESHRSRGDTYTTKLRGSPRSSPVRGGSNLKRSHSALNLSQLRDEDDTDAGVQSHMPSFDRCLKPLESPRRRNINAARQRNFEPKYGSVPRTRTGLKNLGNTCYMNSIIQCLNNTTLLAKYFVEDVYCRDINDKSKQRGDVAEEVGAVMRALWCGQYRSIAMWDLKSVVGRFNKSFRGCDQHDSHEFLITLMDWLLEDLNRITVELPPEKEQNNDNVPDYIAASNAWDEKIKRYDSIIHELFFGLWRSTVECKTCGNKSVTFQQFSVLTLSFSSNSRCTLRDLLNHFHQSNHVEYKCSCCKTLRNSVQTLNLWKLPPVLIIHLNRFENEVLTRKRQNFVDFPIQNLDLTKDILERSPSHSNYYLYGVCNHYGTMDGGHYTAFCRSSINNHWYKFDDHEVYDITPEAVKTPAAYILFYVASNINVKLGEVVMS
ncbi:ubiquitin specific protease 8 isoform X2 [Oratosquilla oratoria]|uniref:ubiquitin specific protease 8 isoform X2 n=1 Tax=Oratosquilla oratoria TaxID=337810 RepID=UPI003F762A04